MIPLCCSLAAFLGCGIASAVYFSYARDAIREKKVRTYNAEATLWRDELAAAYASKWTPPAGASPPRLRVDRGADADLGAPSTDETMTLDLVGPAARGEVEYVTDFHAVSLTPLKGDRGTDYIRLERGAALVTAVENFHAADRRTEIAENVRVRVGDDASAFDISVPAMRCHTGASGQAADWSAKSFFLKTITLVETSGANDAYAGLEAIEGGYACALEYTEWYERVGHYEARNERHAEALCRDGARIPRENVSLTVVVRSPEDPLLTRGELTGCDFFFGVPADTHMEITRRVGFAALALLGLAAIVWCFIARRKIRRRVFGAPRGRK